MPDVTFNEPQQRALRSLMAAEPVPGTPLPPRHVLGHVAVLIPCQSLTLTVADSAGHAIDLVDLAGTAAAGQARGRSVTTVLPGLRWASREPWPARRHLVRLGVADALVLTFRNGPDRLVQLVSERRTRPFDGRDVAVLRLLEPVLARLLAEAPSPHLPDHLTAQERRVLRLVASGRSNAEIAERMGIAPCTVRKHLEHAFPKLGVTNRLAAAMAFQGRSLDDAHQPAPAEMFA